jgi:aminoglycoside 6'-N-acetyltransferase I
LFGDRQPGGDVMEIRQIKLKDIEKVRELEISCIKEYFSSAIENKWEELPKEWKDNLGASSKNHFSSYLESGLSFVAEEDGEIYGFIFAKMLEHIADVNKLVWIENMGVHPYVRRNAIGYKLLREVLRNGQSMGGEVAHSMLQTGNAPSIMLHKKIGFFMDRREVALIDLKDPKLRL